MQDNNMMKIPKNTKELATHTRIVREGFTELLVVNMRKDIPNRGNSEWKWD